MNIPARTLALLVSTVCFGLDWQPINREHLSLSTPRIDKEAGAEALFWEVWVEDSVRGEYATHRRNNYIRLKLFNQRGVDKYGNVEIPYSSRFKTTIHDVRGRTIKTDGTIVDLKKDAIFDTVRSKEGKHKIKQVSFAMPAVEPGAIVEYQWTETYTEFVPQYLELQVQREYPVWQTTYYVKPLPSDRTQYRMRAYPFNCEPTPWVPSTRDFVKTTVQNIPGFQEEPRMLAEDNVRAWILLYYSQDTNEKPEKFWKSYGRKLNGEIRRELKINDDIKRKAAELTASGATPNEKLLNIAEFCRTKIKNTAYLVNGLTAEERNNFKKPNENTADTLRNGIGTSYDVNLLFMALAEAAGFETNWVRGGSALVATARIDLLDPYLFRNRMVAVTVDGKQQFYNPGVPFITPGMLDWDEEGQTALLADDKDPKLFTLPYSPPGKNLLSRSADLTLSEDGTLSGDITFQFAGHYGVERKREYSSMTEPEQVEDFTTEMKERYPGIEVTNVKISNANTPTGTFVVRSTVKLPNFAQRTGKRLFFHPGVFQSGAQPLFTAATRKYPVYFRNPFEERDFLRVRLPAGFKLESPEQPGTTKIATVGEYALTVGVAGDHSLVIQRRLVWGLGDQLIYSPQAYPSLKAAWETLHKFDSHVLTLRQAQGQ